MKPTRNLVLVRLISPPDISQGGIHLIFQQMYKKTRGTVEAIGPKVKNLIVGETVAFGEYSGTEVDADGGYFLLVSEDDIYGVLE